jgi:lipopolysaccharide export system protein LptC
MNIASKYAILFPIALLGLLALLTFWINESVQAPAPKLDGSDRHDPDYIISNFETTQTDVTGALRHKLAAKEMRHFPDNNSTLLQRPIYTQFAINKPSTKLEGERGEMSDDGKLVELFGRVIMTREAFAEKGQMTLETDYLKLKPNEDFFSTPKPVIIRQAPSTVIHAIGMEYDKKKETTTLLSRVRAHYDKPASKAQNNTSNAQTNNNTNAPKTPKSNESKKLKQSTSIQPSANENAPNRIRRSYE